MTRFEECVEKMLSPEGMSRNKFYENYQDPTVRCAARFTRNLKMIQKDLLHPSPQTCLQVSDLPNGQKFVTLLIPEEGYRHSVILSNHLYDIFIAMIDVLPHFQSDAHAF